MKKTDKRTVAAAEWYLKLCETNNEAFIPLFFCESRYLVLKGGGGSGKSIFAGRKIIERAVSEPGHRFLVCRKVGDTLRTSCFDQIRAQINEYYPDSVKQINVTDMTVTFKNGSKILFKGLDNVEKLKSIYDVTGIWIEEASELTKSDFDQLDIRLRTQTPYYLQMILTFNPVSATHWLKGRFFDVADPRATVSETTYLDNRFLTPEAAQVLLNFKDTDEYYYAVYCLGEWGTTGRTVFRASALRRRLEDLPDPVKTGYFDYELAADGVHITDFTWVDDEAGPVKIYEEPKHGYPYVAGGDTAGEGSDFFAGQFLNNVTGEQAAVLHHKYDEDEYARQMYCLGLYFNEALLAVETNYSTYPVKLLGLMGYRRLYVRETFDNFDEKPKHAYGFDTTALTRPVIIGNLVRIMRENARLLNDKETIYEMLTFVKSKNLRPEAEAGAHDDLVMSLAIAYHARGQQSTDAEKEVRRAKWTPDMWEDYRAADTAGRELLLAKWGKPE